MNVVSIMAHQDDEMHCLGTMLKARARGDRLFLSPSPTARKGVSSSRISIQARRAAFATPR